MSSQEPYYCMQTKNLNGVHCSLSSVESERGQCNTCHGIAQEIAQASHGAYHGPYNKKLSPPPVDEDPLDAIAKICRSLTYGEMIDLGKQIYSWSTTKVSGKPIDEEALVKLIHVWSKNYGMDNNTSSGSNTDPNIDTAINDLLKSDGKT